MQRTISLVISMPRRSLRFKPQDWPVLLASERLDHVCGVEDSARSPLPFVVGTAFGDDPGFSEKERLSASTSGRRRLKRKTSEGTQRSHAFGLRKVFT